MYKSRRVLVMERQFTFCEPGASAASFRFEAPASCLTRKVVCFGVRGLTWEAVAVA